MEVEDRTFRRLMAAQRRVREAMASEVIDLGWGRACVSDELRLLYDLNLVEVDTADDAAMVLDATEKIATRVNWNHRKLEVRSEAVAAALAPGLADLGYREDKLNVMRLTKALPAHDSSTSAAIVTARDQEELAAALLAEEPWGKSRDIFESFARRDRLLEQLGLVSFVVAPGHAPLGRALLFDHGAHHDHDIGALFEIDSVSTLRTARGRGYSTVVVTFAIETALGHGASEVVLVADPSDWPHDWYLRLGFEPIGSFSQFDRVPEEA